MQIKSESLADHLAGTLAPLYVVSGDEALLVIEAADRIRLAARSRGFSEREVLVNERGFRWERLDESARSMSLFGERKLIDLRIPTGKPGREGAQALGALAARTGPDLMALVTLPRLDREQRSAAWFTALEKAGVVLEIALVERQRLPAWIGGRLAAQDQRCDGETLTFIAERVEGNLLAAHQEIQKLGLLFPKGPLSFEQVQDCVLNVARYDVFKLTEAMLAGDAARLARTLEGLRAEGDAPVLVHWVMTDEIRNLLRVALAQRDGRPLVQVLRELRIWGARERLYETALRRLRPAVLGAALQRAAELDKMAKGLRLLRGSGSIWDELLRLGLLITNAKP
jgi:DNA polymerase-3 subunit delta